MDIIDMKLKDLKPYAKNPRKNDAAVDIVANSIKEFGFKVPIVLDRNNEVVAGHTRLRAAKKLGLKTVPCIIADDLNDEQIKAFRIADNTSAEYAQWDVKLLQDEIKEIFSIDMGGFGIQLDDDKNIKVYDDTGSEMSADDYINKYGGTDDMPDDLNDNDDDEEVSYKILDKHENIDIRLFDGVGDFDIPPLQPCKLEDYEDCDFIPWSEFFNQTTKEKRGELGVHFFVHDYRFEGMWRNIDHYIHLLLEHKYIITPDFSLYTNYPKAVKIFNHYRNMWVGAYIQEKAKESDSGVKVIPNIVYGNKNENWVFDGMPKNGVVAFSVVGMTQADAWKNVMELYDRMYDILNPSAILWFRKEPTGIKGNIIRKTAFIDKFQKEGD